MKTMKHLKWIIIFKRIIPVNHAMEKAAKSINNLVSEIEYMG